MVRALVAVLFLLSTATPARAADRSRILFVSGRTGSMEIYAVQPTTRRVSQLTFGAHQRDVCAPTPSPDGRSLVYVVSAGAGGCYGGTIVLAGPAGGHPRVLTSGNQPAWSRDSKRVVYAAHSIWSVDQTGRHPVRWSIGDDDRLPAFSPDGSAVAFVRYRPNGPPQLVVSRRGRESVYADGLGASRPAWSPDGRRLAYRYIRDGNEGLEVVRVGDRRVRQLVSGPFSYPFNGAPAWSGDGGTIAFPTSSALLLVDATSGRYRRVKLSAYAVSWSPRGDAVAAVSGAGISVVTRAGRTGLVYAEASCCMTFQFAAAWTMPPAGTRYPDPEPVPVFAVAHPAELDLRSPVGELSSNDGRAAFVTCGGRALGTWQLETGATAPVGPFGVTFCRPDGESCCYNRSLPALSGQQVLYLEREGGIQVHWTLWLTTIGKLERGTWLSSGGTCCAGDPWLPPVGYLHSDGDLLVFSTWEKDPITRGHVLWQAVWRVHAGFPGASCGDPRGPCALVAYAQGKTIEPLAVNTGRIVVLRDNAELDLLDTQGETLRAIPTAPVVVAGAELDDNELIVLTRGSLRVYDVASGALARTWALPDMPVDICSGNRYFCDSGQLRLVGAAHGVVAYEADGTVHLIRLSDGSELLSKTATDASLDRRGLFWSWNGPDPWPGRISFLRTP